MRLIQATKLRAKTVALQVCDTVLKYAARSSGRRYLAALNSGHPDPRVRRLELAHQARVAHEVALMRKDCADLIVSHRFDIAIFNEGLISADQIREAV